MEPHLRCRKFEDITSNASDYQIMDEATFVNFLTILDGK